MRTKFRLLTVLLLLSFASCEFDGVYVDSGYSSGGGWSDDDGWYDDGGSDWDSDWDSGGGSDWDDDDWGSDWGSDDDGYDYNDDDCWDCGDDWGWYDDAQTGGQSHSSDIMGDVAEKEQVELNKAAKFFSNRFNLSDEQSLKVAKTIHDFEALEKRDASDLAAFSQKLYGLNPEEIVTSIALAQTGDYSKLDSAIEKAASNFDTTSANMREIVKTLHKSVLKDNGIEL